MENAIIIICSFMIIEAAIAIYVIVNLMTKVERYEDEIEKNSVILASYMDYLNKISDIIRVTDEKLIKIDESDRFKSDDEIGWFFENIQEIQKILNLFKIKKL